MNALLDIGVLAAVLGALGPQGPVQSPSPPTLVPPTSTGRPTSADDMYPDMGGVELDRVAFEGTSFHRKKVVVRGMLGDLVYGQYLSLQDGIARVMLIPLDPGDYYDWRSLMSVEVEVTGVVRVLPQSQRTVPCLGQMLPESKCDDPELPVLPNVQSGWPLVSITVMKISDRGTGRDTRRGRERDLTDTGLEAAAADGKPVKAVGQFRGANLCRDLPDATRRDPRDWVLLTAEGPVWITGRRPEGGGFKLDPAYRGDVDRWLEVTGRVTVSGESMYLRAGKVAIIARPPEAEGTPCPP